MYDLVIWRFIDGSGDRSSIATSSIVDERDMNG
jgi:hypothetical protein